MQTPSDPLNVTQFLLARIAEDEARAASLLANTQEGYDINSYAERVLADCEVKRQIVNYWGPVEAVEGPRLLAVMATVYKDHPDYNEGWLD